MLLSPEDVERAVEPIAALPEEFFLLSDIICPNESETELITGLPVGSIDEATAAARALLAKGAGDAFIGSLAYFVAAGKALPEAVRRANDIAAISVQASGTQSSFPNAADLPVELRE